MNISKIQNYVLENLAEIRVLYNEVIERRENKVILEKVIQEARLKIFAENDFHVMKGYEDVIEFDIIRDPNYSVLMDNSEHEKYNQAFYNEIKDNDLFFKYFNIERDESCLEYVAFLEANNGSHFDQDRKLVDLVRGYNDKPSSHYDFEMLDKEIELIGKIVEYYKNY